VPFLHQGRVGVANSGRSVIAPPWTTLTAYDLNSGEIRWKVRLGDEPSRVLWEVTVDAALEAMPAVYEQAGRQYVVFCAAARTSTHAQATPAPRVRFG